MANGFLASRPEARHGDSLYYFAGDASGGKFTAPGSGILTINEIGFWADSETGMGTKHAHLAIFDDDAINGVPSTIVTNSDSEELTVLEAGGFAVYYATYGTKPQVTGGNNYWLCWVVDGGNTLDVSRFDTGGTSAASVTVTYPNWPSDVGWHGAVKGTRDYGIYAVYDSGGGLDIKATKILLNG